MILIKGAIIFAGGAVGVTFLVRAYWILTDHPEVQALRKSVRRDD